MLKIDIFKDAASFIRKREPKHQKQIANRILQLASSPYPQDAKALKSTQREYFRVDAGEYRIIYLVDQDMLKVVLVGKRNDDEVYRKFSRKQQ